MINQTIGNHGLGFFCQIFLVRFDLGPLVQGQTRIAKLKSAYNLRIIKCEGRLFVYGRISGSACSVSSVISAFSFLHNSVTVGRIFFFKFGRCIQ